MTMTAGLRRREIELSTNEGSLMKNVNMMIIPIGWICVQEKDDRRDLQRSTLGRIAETGQCRQVRLRDRMLVAKLSPQCSSERGSKDSHSSRGCLYLRFNWKVSTNERKKKRRVSYLTSSLVLAHLSEWQFLSPTQSPTSMAKVRGGGATCVPSSCRRRGAVPCRPGWRPRLGGPACSRRTRRKRAIGCPPADCGHAPQTCAETSASAGCAPGDGEPSLLNPGGGEGGQYEINQEEGLKRFKVDGA